MRHYIRFSEAALKYASQVDPTHSSREAIIADLNGSAGRLRLVDLPPNTVGERVGILGGVVYCELGFDQQRSDAFFTTRLSAIPKSLRSESRLYEAQLRLFSGGDSPPLEAVKHAFSGSQGTAKQIARTLRLARRQSAITALTALLSQAPHALRAAWRPREPSSASTSIANFLASVRRPWSRFRLERHVRADDRSTAIFKGSVHPRDLDPAARSLLLEALDVAMLHSVVDDDSTGNTDLVNLLYELQSLDLS